MMRHIPERLTPSCHSYFPFWFHDEDPLVRMVLVFLVLSFKLCTEYQQSEFVNK